MQIEKVASKSDLKKFIEFPWKIYKNDPLWVPPLIEDVKFALEKSPFWEHSEKELFLLYDGEGETIGRIAAVIDANFTEFHGEKTGFFGFFECIDSAEAASALYGAAEDWLEGRGMKKMVGPMNPSSNDECGFLCDGFELPPRLMMPYTPGYYLELAEKCGLKKAKELYAYEMEVSKGPAERLEKLVKIAYKKNQGLKVRSLNKKDFRNEIDKAIQVYNSAWEKNWGFVPWTEKEFHTMASRFKDLLLFDTTLIAEINGKPAGLLIAMPDYNFVMKRMNGRLFPFGIIKFLLYKGRIDALRLMIMGVVKECRQRGIEGVMYYEALRNAARLGYRKCEFSWVLDDNIMTQRAAEMMGGRLYKKYRIYGN
ncbi:MAG: hypothetical protein JW803_02925 [Endomicrobiales bacterium]|nr:hypothetical protein [Endomicrobiales bacterium]